MPRKPGSPPRSSGLGKPIRSAPKPGGKKRPK